MKNIKKWLLGAGFLSLVLLLSGCVSMNKDGTPNEKGLIYRFLVTPMGNMITYMVDHFNWSYGIAIIVLTIIVRVIILPIGINQSKKSMIQAEKMQVLKPQIELAQAKVKEATTREEQMQAQMEMQSVYKENGVSMLGGVGCLPLLIQMPIFSALYFTARYAHGISSSTFLGMNMGDPSMILVVIVGVSYALQGWLSLFGIPEEQKKTMRTMMFASPLMIVFMSFSSPAAVALYWVVGGFFSCIQTFITNVLMRPRIKQQVAEEMKANPPKQVVTPRKEVAPKPTEKTVEKTAGLKNPGNNSGRNAGKQQRRK